MSSHHNNPLIKTKNLNVVYDEGTPAEYRALTDINIEIYDGEYVIFFGPSGSGKSTLLYSLAGLERRITGDITVDGITISDMTDHELEEFHRTKVGMVFQAYYLIPSVTILDNVALPQIFSDASLQSRRDRAFKLLEKFNVAQLSDRLPSALSGGQQQRVAIARALVNSPKILVADEPVGNLDSKSRKNVMDVFYKLNHEDKQTIVMVTHEPEHLSYADRIFYMKDGRIVKVIKNARKHAPLAPIPDEFRSRTQAYAAVQGQSSGEQVGSTFRGELQALLGRMPNLPQDQLKARLLMDYLLTTLRESELTRIENMLTKRIRGDIDEQQLIEEFDKSFREGGVGLNFTTARHFTNKVSDVLHQAEVLSKPYADNLKALYLAHLLKAPQVGYNYDDLTDDQKESLREALIARIQDKIGPDNFYLLLEKREADSGVGLSPTRARAYAHLVEVLLAERDPQLREKIKSQLNDGTGDGTGDGTATATEKNTSAHQLLLPAPHRIKDGLGNIAISSISTLLIDAFGAQFSEAKLRKLAHYLKLYLQEGVDRHIVQRQIVEDVGIAHERVLQLFNQIEEILYLSFITKLSQLIEDYFALAGEQAVTVTTDMVKQWLRAETDRQTFVEQLNEALQAAGLSTAPADIAGDFFKRLKQLRHGMGTVIQ